MKSIRTSVRRTMVVLALVVFTAIIINLVIVFKIRIQVADMGEKLHDLRTDYNDIKYPLTVLNDTMAQINSFEIFGYEKIEIMSKTYESSYMKISESVTGISNNITYIKKDISSLNAVTLGIFSKYFGGMSNPIRQAEKNIEYFNNEFEYIGAELPYKEVDLLPLQNKFKRISPNIRRITKSHTKLINVLISGYTFAITAFLIFLLFVTIYFSRKACKVLNKDLNFIIKGFRLLENHNYDYKELPIMYPKYKEEHQVYDLVNNIIEEQSFSTKIKDIVISSYMMDDLLDALFYNIEKDLNVDRIGIAFVDYKNDRIIAEHRVGNYTNFKIGPGYESSIAGTSLSEVINTKSPLIISDIPKRLMSNPNSLSLNLLCEEGIKSNMTVPLIMKDAVFGFLFFSSTKRNAFDKESLSIANKITYDITGYLNRSYLTKVVFSRITNTFAELVDKKDNETGGHIKRMVKYSVIIAEGLMEKSDHDYPVDKKLIVEIERHASSHDIGKVGVPDEILKKPGKLTPDEWEIMKNHSLEGGNIFKDFREELRVFDDDFYKVAEEIATYHHEKWDGSGYPKNLKGTEIPLSARIVAVADVFDALTSPRVYKSAFTFEDSTDIILDSKGKHFDPVIVDSFISKINEIQYVYDNY